MSDTHMLNNEVAIDDVYNVSSKELHRRYQHYYHCVNCKKWFPKYILKGNKVPTVNCPNCDCVVFS